MKYNFRIEVPIHEKARVTDEMLKRECIRSLSEAIQPIVSLGQMGSTLSEGEIPYKNQIPKFKADGSIYAYNTEHMEHIIQMLRVVEASVNPVQANIITEVIKELTVK